jgi:hypothetical protein
VQEIAAMRDRLEDNIEQRGFDSAVDAASRALEWALGSAPLDEVQLQRYMERPEADRRRDWLAFGGKPEDWPVHPAADATKES